MTDSRSWPEAAMAADIEEPAYCDDVNGVGFGKMHSSIDADLMTMDGSSLHTHVDYALFDDAGPLTGTLLEDFVDCLDSNMLGLDNLASFKVQPATPHSRPGSTKGTWLGDEQEEEKWIFPGPGPTSLKEEQLEDDLGGGQHGPDDASSGAGSGRHGQHGAGHASGHSSGCEEEQSGSPHHHTTHHAGHHSDMCGLVPFDSISSQQPHHHHHHQPCAGSRRGSHATLLGLELSEEDPLGCLAPMAGEPWDFAACTSSHPLSHHCPGATNIELLEAPEEEAGAGGLMHPLTAHQHAPHPTQQQNHQHQQPSGSKQPIMIVHRPPVTHHRPRVPPVLAPQPSRVAPSPFINSSGNRVDCLEASGSGGGWGGGHSHPSASSPGTDASDATEEDANHMLGLGPRKYAVMGGRPLKPARSVPNFGAGGMRLSPPPGSAGHSPRTGHPYHTAPDLLAPAPKRQALMRRSPSEGFDLMRPRGVGPADARPASMAPAAVNSGGAHAMNMPPPRDLHHQQCEMGVEEDEEAGGLCGHDAGMEDGGMEHHHQPTGQVEAWVFDPSLPSTEGVVLPSYAMGPHIPPEARPALAALAAMLPPRNNKKRANGGHGSTCARPAPHPHGHGCTACGTHTTPVWRAGPAGPKTLCNACGVRYMKVARGGGVSTGKK